MIIKASTSGRLTADARITAKTIKVSARTIRIIEARTSVRDSRVRAAADLAAVKARAKARLYTKVLKSYDDIDYYEGSYEAVPKTETSTQVFETADKLMRKNFLVYTIPTTEEYNEQGGVTFTIGG